MMFDKPITVQRMDDDTEEWVDLWHLHARINTAKQSETFDSGAEHANRFLVFEVRYAVILNRIACNTQLYRIKFDNVIYNIKEFDDYMLQHNTIKLTAVSVYE